MKNTEETFWGRVDKTGDCWVWKGKLHYGYGHFCFEGKTRFASRYSYIFTHGSIPEGLHVDHLCRNRSCVRPSHLEAITNAENRRRGLMGILKTECPKGHTWKSENLYKRSDGSLSCRICRYDFHRRYRIKNSVVLNAKRQIKRKAIAEAGR